MRSYDDDPTGLRYFPVSKKMGNLGATSQDHPICCSQIV